MRSERATVDFFVEVLVGEELISGVHASTVSEEVVQSLSNDLANDDGNAELGSVALLPVLGGVPHVVVVGDDADSVSNVEDSTDPPGDATPLPGREEVEGILVAGISSVESCPCDSDWEPDEELRHVESAEP